MKHILQVLIVLLFLSVLAACGEKVKPQTDAEKYFQQGERLFEASMYEDAIASWEKVRDTYYSPELNMLAELKIADTYFISEKYAEAAAAYADFLQQHPNDSRAGTVTFRMGLSHYKQILSADRDQTSTENALKAFQRFVDRFPSHPKVPEAKNLILRCKTRLAEHEVYVGRFYLKRDQFKPAILRLEGVLKAYPDYYYRDEAYYYLAKAYLGSNQPQKARPLLKRLTQEFPGSKFQDEAQELLSSSS